MSDRLASTQLEIWVNNVLVGSLDIPRDGGSSGETDLPPLTLSLEPGLSVVRLKLLSGDANLNSLTFASGVTGGL